MKLLITGTFRSGTTLIAQILNQNSNISVTYDSVNFMRFCYQKYGANSLSLENATKLGIDVNERLMERTGKGINLPIFQKSLSVARNPLSYALIYDLLMQSYLGVENWGEKTVLEWRNALNFLEMFSDGFVIHIIRDPRDVLASWKKMTKAPGYDYLDALSNCYDSMKYALENKKITPKRYYVIKFEDLLTHSETEVRKICDFLGILFESQMLMVNKYKSMLKDVKWDPNFHTMFEDDIKGISKKPIGRWKKHLRNEEIIISELVNGDYMDIFGYKKSAHRPPIQDMYSIFKMLAQSPLALNGILNIIHFKEGVQRYPLNPFDKKTWDNVRQ